MQPYSIFNIEDYEYSVFKIKNFIQAATILNIQNLNFHWEQAHLLCCTHWCRMVDLQQPVLLQWYVYFLLKRYCFARVILAYFVKLYAQCSPQLFLIVHLNRFWFISFAPITKSRRFQYQRKREICKEIYRSVHIFHDLPIHQLWMILNQFSKSGMAALCAAGEGETSDKG